MPTLTKKQKAIFEFIESYIEKHGISPTLEEICRRFKKAVGTIHEHIEELAKKKFLKKTSGIRGLEIVKNNKTVEIPLKGYIAAGQPVEAIEMPSETIAIAKSEIGKIGDYYALQVKGDSMIDEGIFDGDTVIVKKQPIADDGQTVVAIIDDNEATLKKIYREKNRMRLQPANQLMLPIYRKEVEIRGVVVKIIRNLENKSHLSIFSEIDKNTLEFTKKKNDFLNEIRSKNENSRNKYKRVAVTPLRYAGGKSLAVGFIVELLPNNIKKMISPFFGGGSVEIACNKHLDMEIIGFDIFDILVNYWKVQTKNPSSLHKKLSQFQPDAKTYKEVKERLKAHWKNNAKLSSVDLAAHYYYNHNLSYGPGFLGWPSKVYLNKKRYETMIEKVRGFSVDNLRVEHASFETAFEKYPNDFFYCDPPYLLGEGTKMFRGIYPMRNIPIHHNGFDHEKLRNLLKKHKGGFVLSYNNCETIRNWYRDFEQHFPKWQYTMGQGETRIGKNRKNGNINHVKESHEIIIFSPQRNR